MKKKFEAGDLTSKDLELVIKLCTKLLYIYPLSIIKMLAYGNYWGREIWLMINNLPKFYLPVLKNTVKLLRTCL